MPHCRCRWLNVLPVVVVSCLLTFRHHFIVPSHQSFMLPDTQLPIRNIADHALNRKGVKSPDITRSEGYWIVRKAEWVRIAGYPSHRDKKAWCFWGVLVRWNVGLRLKTLKMSSRKHEDLPGSKRSVVNVPVLQAPSILLPTIYICPICQACRSLWSGFKRAFPIYACKLHKAVP